MAVQEPTDWIILGIIYESHNRRSDFRVLDNLGQPQNRFGEFIQCGSSPSLPSPPCQADSHAVSRERWAVRRSVFELLAWPPARLRASSTTEQQLGARIPGQAARSRYLRRLICLAMYAIRSSVLAPRMSRRPANSLTQRRFALLEGSCVAALGPERLHPVRVSRTSDAVPDRFVLMVEQYTLRPRRRLHRLPCAPPRSLAEFRRKCRKRLRLSLVRQRGRQRSCQRPRARRGVSRSHACSSRVHPSRRPRPDRRRPGFERLATAPSAKLISG